MTDTLQATLEEQRRYYQARAAEYDQWFYRQVRQSLKSIRLTGHVLEFAAGTGIWTQELLKTADHVTALDSSAEVLEINRGKLQPDNVTYVVADIFAWQPQIQYDAAFMGFWLSHVPPVRFDSFLDGVAAALRPGGKIFLVDSLPTLSGTAKDQAAALKNHQTLQQSSATDESTLTRRLNDGREFQIIKVFYQPDELAAKFHLHNIDAVVEQTENFFLYGWGTKTP
jgi:ubiquinone/menaquinone biosynthesis C-methylase UbiE